MATPAAIRDAIQTRLNTVSGLRSFDLVQGNVPTPCAFVLPVGFTQEAQDGSGTWRFAVDLYVSFNSMRAGQDALDAYLPNGTKDVKDAIESDGDLGGTVDSAICDLNEGSYGLKSITVGDQELTFLGCSFDVTVMD